MNRPSQVIVLAEDKRHQRFVWNFLKLAGYNGHEVRLWPLPAGGGSGERYVREHYAEQVSAYRRRATRAQTALIVAIDADTQEVQHRARQLAEALSGAGMEARSGAEAIVHLIPKRNVETWILCLFGKDVNEEADYSNRADINDLIAKAAVEFFNWSRDQKQVPERCVSSLKEGLTEVNRLSSSPQRRS